MNKKVTIALLLSLVFGFAACGGGGKPANQGNKQQDGSTEEDKIQDEDKIPWKCQATHTGFAVKYTEGHIIQNPSQQNGMLQINGLDVGLGYDSYYKREAPESYPYNNIQIEIYAEDGKNYPIKAGIYKLGANAGEQNPHTCSNCVFLGMDVNKKGNPQKKLFATSGQLVITAIDEGHVQATLKRAYFVEYTEEYHEEDGSDVVATLLRDGEDWCVESAVFDGTSFHVYQGN